MKKLIFFFVVVMAMPLGFLGINIGYCASSSDIDRLTTYATIIGRGAGCGFEIENEMLRVGRWMERVFNESEKGTYLSIFIQGVSNAAEQQSKGQSPDSCSTIRNVLNTTVWP